MGLGGIFKVVPEVQYAWAWNTEDRTWEFAMRDGYTTGGWLTPGMDLFLWIVGDEIVEWRPEPFVPPVVVFDDTVSDDFKRLAQDHVKSVMAFFAERYGTWVSGLRVEYGPTLGCYFYGPQPDGTILVTSVTTLHGSCFPHEYGHALHFHFAGDRERFQRIIWMIEGIANYFGTEIWGDWKFYQPDYGEYYSRYVEPLLRDRTDPWPEGVVDGGEPNRLISQRAIVHLVNLVGEETFLEGLGKSTFMDAFGIRHDEFLVSFDMMRLSLGENPTASGKIIRKESVVDATDITVGLIPISRGWPSFQLIGEDGKFKLQFRGISDTYIFQIFEHDKGEIRNNSSSVVACKIVLEGGRSFKNLTIDHDKVKQLRPDSTYDLDRLPMCEEMRP